MNTILFDLSELCESMSVKDFTDYCGIPKHLVYYRGKKKNICNYKKELNEWLEIKIRKLIRIKKNLDHIVDANEKVSKY